MRKRNERRVEQWRHPSRMPGPTVAPEGAKARWPEHRWLARLIRVLVFCVPIVLSFVVAMLMSGWLASPDAFWARIVRWVGIAAAATLVMMIAQRVMRRLLPLAALLSLTLVFPDETPSRFGLALRGMSARQLEKKLEEVGESGLGETPREAAETLLELVAALSTHDRLTRGHSERVRAYSMMIGEELELGPEDLDRLRWAALLHDVGKLHVPYELLNKPGTLTDEEFELVKEHTIAGQAMVAPLADWLGDAADAVYEHHERFAGGGYPTGTPAEQLTLTSRIVSVADAFDVMTSARSYKAAASAGAARAELERCAGSQFDPAVVRAIMNVSLGKLWRTMGPMSWVAQIGLFPRPVTQGGTGATVAAAALLALLLTGLAEASRFGGTNDDAAQVAAAAPPSTTTMPPNGDVSPAAAAPEPALVTAPPAVAVTTSTMVPLTVAPRSVRATTTTLATTTLATTTLAPATSTPALVTTTTIPATTSTTTTTTATSARTTTTVPAAPPTSTSPTSTSVPATSTTTSTTTTSTTSTTSTSTTTTSTTTSTTTTTTTVPGGVFRLASPGPGDQVSQPVLDLVPGSLVQNGSPVPNYDTDRNADPGLTLVRSAQNLRSGDPAAVQVWRFGNGVDSINGSVSLVIYLAPDGPLGGGHIQVIAGLFECTADRSSCSEVVRDTPSVDAIDGTFVPVAFDLTPSSLPHVAPSGQRLELRVSVSNGSSNNVWYGYDSADAPARLLIAG